MELLNTRLFRSFQNESKAFSLLLGNPLAAMAPLVWQRRILNWNKVMKVHWMQQLEPYLPTVDTTDQEMHASLCVLCTEGT
jgi:hypothetical protein